MREMKLQNIAKITAPTIYNTVYKKANNNKKKNRNEKRI